MRKRKFLFFIIISIFILTGSCSEREGEEKSYINEESLSFKNEEIKRVSMRRKKEMEEFSVSLRRNPFLRWEEEERFNQKKIRKVIDYLNLTAIFYSSSRSFAVIDGYVVKEGDMIAGKKVVEINPKAVILEDEKGKYILPLKE